MAYPLSFDWTWLHWYFMAFTGASPFNHSRCFDIKTAYAVKAGVSIAGAGRAKLAPELVPEGVHTHHALETPESRQRSSGACSSGTGPRGGDSGSGSTRPSGSRSDARGRPAGADARCRAAWRRP